MAPYARNPEKTDPLEGMHPERRAQLMAANNSASQQQNNPSSQPPAAGGLFGTSSQQSTQAGNLFGGAAAQQQQATGGTGGGLFGASTSQQPANNATGSGLFGASTTQSQPTGGLFGASTTQQPQQQTSGLFGASTNQQPQQQTGGLFGASTTQQPQQQTSSLFGNTQNAAGGTQQQSSGGLFQNLNQPAQQQSGGLFGASQTQPKPNLFGATATNPPAAGNSLFGTSSLFGNQNNMNQQQQQQQQQQAQQPNVFGLSATAPPAPTSLLNASQYRASQYQPFSGKLTMGQNTTAPQQPQVGAAKVNFDEMRPTTRYADCIDAVKEQFEFVDKMIQNQERFAREIEAFIPRHGENVESLKPDVEFVAEKAEAAELALARDASGVVAAKRVLEGDSGDFKRVERIVTNLTQPVQYRYVGGLGGGAATGAAGEAAKDMDLVSNYFMPLTHDLQKTLRQYETNLAEIEGHMRVLEQSALAQAQHLAAKRAGGGVGGSVSGSGEETVRELADTLRGFEASILGAADLVGQCREGVNGLVLAKFGDGLGRR